ncbi:WAT1-related protein At5g64700-like isoform X1 [Rhododendron vialii]|uniref:WAT1-related protein At5g64700-like isoform X1 n=1 Tax=Rhododendron vialii TaxID=182163 RepID=UPI00265D87F3|nr:WAT1-related protein At5g64700-like isoform X1 [Rhododendron vialii]
MIVAMGEKKPYLVAILFQSIIAGTFILSKAVLNEGMNSFVFIFYRQLAGAIVLIAVVIFKRESPTPISSMAFWKIFMLSLVGITLGFNVYGVALEYTSPTLAAASNNCLQPMTFFLTILLGMEKVKLRTIGGVAKVVGIMLCMSGVVTLALYKGPYLRPIVHHHLLDGSQQAQNHYSGDQNWIKGCLLMFLATLCWALWYVYQAPVMKDCPSMLIFTTLQSLLSAIQTGAVAIAVERDIFQWKLGWDVRLIAVVYSGIMTTAVGTNLMAWLLEKKGPVFHAMWTPLGLVITTLFSTFLLGEVISLGSVLGGILLVGSLYCVLWGKRKEEELKRLSIQGALKAEVEQHI